MSCEIHGNWELSAIIRTIEWQSDVYHMALNGVVQKREQINVPVHTWPICHCLRTIELWTRTRSCLSQRVKSSLRTFFFNCCLHAPELWFVFQMVVTYVMISVNQRTFELKRKQALLKFPMHILIYSTELIFFLNYNATHTQQLFF